MSPEPYFARRWGSPVRRLRAFEMNSAEAALHFYRRAVTGRAVQPGEGSFHGPFSTLPYFELTALLWSLPTEWH
jgi:hypothetical protein